MQTHDFNPGINANGVFWTVPIPDNAVDVQFGAGEAFMALNNFAVSDYFNIVNALVRQGNVTLPPGVGPFGPDDIPARVSFDILWSGRGQKVHVKDATAGFRGTYLLDTSTVLSLSASEAAAGGQPSFQFFATSSTNEFSLLGHERNGRFFSQSDDGGDDD